MDISNQYNQTRKRPLEPGELSFQKESICMICGQNGSVYVHATDQQIFVAATQLTLSKFINKTLGEQANFAACDTVCPHCFSLLQELDLYQAKAMQIHQYLVLRYKDTKEKILTVPPKMTDFLTSSLANIKKYKHGTTLNVSNDLSVTVFHDSISSKSDQTIPKSGKEFPGCSNSNTPEVKVSRHNLSSSNDSSQSSKPVVPKPIVNNSLSRESTKSPSRVPDPNIFNNINYPALTVTTNQDYMSGEDDEETYYSKLSQASNIVPVKKHRPSKTLGYKSQISPDIWSSGSNRELYAGPSNDLIPTKKLRLSKSPKMSSEKGEKISLLPLNNNHIAYECIMKEAPDSYKADGNTSKDNLPDGKAGVSSKTSNSTSTSSSNNKSDDKSDSSLLMLRDKLTPDENIDLLRRLGGSALIEGLHRTRSELSIAKVDVKKDPLSQAEDKKIANKDNRNIGKATEERYNLQSNCGTTETKNECTKRNYHTVDNILNDTKGNGNDTCVIKEEEVIKECKTSEKDDINEVIDEQEAEVEEHEEINENVDVNTAEFSQNIDQPQLVNKFLEGSLMAKSIFDSFLSTSLWMGGMDVEEPEASQEQDDWEDKPIVCDEKETRLTLKNMGKRYVNTKGKVVEARKMQPQDCSKCHLHCNDKIPEAERQNIFQEFWDLGDYDLQRQYMANHMDRAMKTVGHNGSLRAVVSYYVSNTSGSKIQTCRQFFLKTLDISEKAPRLTLEKKIRGGFDTPAAEASVGITEMETKKTNETDTKKPTE